MIQIDIHKDLKGASGDFSLKVNTTLPSEKIVILRGESGAGKTTLLRILAGLTEATGKICLSDRCWLDSTKTVKAGERNIGFVFQDYALFPNMNVRQNISFAVNDKGSDKDVDTIIKRMELDALAEQKPHQLSGGQKQRVALARAIVQKPDLLLLDEPLAALDKSLRLKLQNYLKNLQKEFNLSIIMVSHSRSETLKLADHVIELSNGAVVFDAGIDEFSHRQKLSDGIVLDAEVIELSNETVSLLLADKIFDIERHQIPEDAQIGDIIKVSLKSNGKLMSVE